MSESDFCNAKIFRCFLCAAHLDREGEAGSAGFAALLGRFLPRLGPHGNPRGPFYFLSRGGGVRPQGPAPSLLQRPRALAERPWATSTWATSTWTTSIARGPRQRGATHGRLRACLHLRAGCNDHVHLQKRNAGYGLGSVRFTSAVLQARHGRWRAFATRPLRGAQRAPAGLQTPWPPCRSIRA